MTAIAANNAVDIVANTSLLTPIIINQHCQLITGENTATGINLPAESIIVGSELVARHGPMLHDAEFSLVFARRLSTEILKF